MLYDMEGMEGMEGMKFDMEGMEGMEARMAPSKFDFEDMESRSPAASLEGGSSYKLNRSRTKSMPYNFEDTKFDVWEIDGVDFPEFIDD